VLAGPVVDTPSAQEFQREILHYVDEAELRSIAADLERKSAAMRALVSGGVASADPDSLRELLGLVFAARRRADRILETVGAERLAGAIAHLMDESEPVVERIDHFDADLGAHGTNEALGRFGFDLPSEVLHFCQPEQYWLWTRWIWDPAKRTGALALVTTDALDPDTHSTRGAAYMSVGRAMAFVEETGKAAGFTAVGPGLFGLDVLLGAVYAVYAYTIIGMRMTRQFNDVMPSLTDLVRRLLGVYHLEVC
jgi:hypothetical protein